MRDKKMTGKSSGKRKKRSRLKRRKRSQRGRGERKAEEIDR